MPIVALSRLEDRISPEPNTGCWLWTGARTQAGYGVMSRGYAHRIVYEIAKGAISDGLEIDHLCRVTCCVNPDHLEAVTPRVNKLRGTSPAATHARQASCIHGHLFDDANTGHSGTGRYCRTCLRERAQRRARARGIQPRQRVDQCKYGHAYDAVNTYTKPDGSRDCRECMRGHGRAYKQRVKARHANT